MNIPIQPHTAAPIGSVAELRSYEPSEFDARSAILCRNTAPLVSFAFGLIRRNVGCRVLGREIGQGLVLLVKKLAATNVDDLLARLDHYETREVARLKRKDEVQAIDNLRDRVSCIRLFIDNAPDSSRTIDDVCRRITALFDDTASGLLTLSTIHKAKGLEWPTVFILDGWASDKPLLPSPYARLPWQKQQELNLCYVAITRAQLDLRYISSGHWKPEQRAPNEGSPSLLQQLADED